MTTRRAFPRRVFFAFIRRRPNAPLVRLRVPELPGNHRPSAEYRRLWESSDTSVGDHLDLPGGEVETLVQTVPSLQHIPILAERYAAVGVVWSILQFSPLTQMSADEVSEAVLRVIVVAIEAVKFGMMALGLVALFPA